MIRLVDPVALGIPTIALPDVSGEQASACHRCEAFRPEPTLDGNLTVDPEIVLPSPGINVDIASFYNSNLAANGPFGYGRTLSTNMTAVASGSPAIVTLIRGSGSVVSFQDNGSGTFLPKTPGLLNTLVKDTVGGYWKESTPDGHLTAYPLNTTGQITSIAYAQDAVGNTHTFTYASGLLQTLQDAVGRFVTFGYSGGRLQSVEDWAGRFTTFAYDTHSAAPKNLLTTLTGPTGCQTLYQHQLVGSVNDWLLTGITDPNGYLTTYSYDSNRRVVLRGIAGIGLHTYTYNAGTVLMQDPMGARTTHAVNANMALTASTNPLGAGTDPDAQCQRPGDKPGGRVWEPDHHPLRWLWQCDGDHQCAGVPHDRHSRRVQQPHQCSEPRRNRHHDGMGVRRKRLRHNGCEAADAGECRCAWEPYELRLHGARATRKRAKCARIFHQFWVRRLWQPDHGSGCVSACDNSELRSCGQQDRLDQPAGQHLERELRRAEPGFDTGGPAGQYLYDGLRQRGQPAGAN